MRKKKQEMVEKHIEYQKVGSAIAKETQRLNVSLAEDCWDSTTPPSTVGLSDWSFSKKSLKRGGSLHIGRITCHRKIT
uniref:Uncharacterized protein n=1 Tax=Anguilla anguilla TaxID=7936 RepID=A0A0E9QT91_ANGAN